ncbi:MAG: hypothetical protein ACREK9_00735 [Candidatus Rokuibacteriota bacterium]
MLEPPGAVTLYYTVLAVAALAGDHGGAPAARTVGHRADRHRRR